MNNLREHLQLDHVMTREKYVEILERGDEKFWVVGGSSGDLVKEDESDDQVSSREAKLIQSSVSSAGVTKKFASCVRELKPVDKDLKDLKNTNCTVCQEYFPTRKIFMKHCKTKHTASRTGKHVTRESPQSTTKCMTEIMTVPSKKS